VCFCARDRCGVCLSCVGTGETCCCLHGTRFSCGYVRAFVRHPLSAPSCPCQSGSLCIAQDSSDSGPVSFPRFFWSLFLLVPLDMPRFRPHVHQPPLPLLPRLVAGQRLRHELVASLFLLRPTPQDQFPFVLHETLLRRTLIELPNCGKPVFVVPPPDAELVIRFCGKTTQPPPGRFCTPDVISLSCGLP